MYLTLTNIFSSCFTLRILLFFNLLGLSREVRPPPLPHGPLDSTASSGRRRHIGPLGSIPFLNKTLPIYNVYNVSTHHFKPIYSFSSLRPNISLLSNPHYVLELLLDALRSSRTTVVGRLVRWSVRQSTDVCEKVTFRESKGS